MVLQAAAESSPDAFSDAVPSGDFDSSSPASHLGLTIDLSKFPQPAPFTKLFYPDRVRASKMQQTILDVENHIQRPMTEQEANAWTYHFMKANAWATWGILIGAGAGWYRHYTTRAEMKWAFMNVEGTRNWNEKLGGKVQGSVVRALWQTLRLMPYLSFGMFTGFFVFSSVGTTVCAVGISQDQRLKSLTAAMVQSRKRLPEQRRPTAPAARPDEKPDDGSQWGNVDDMSPTATNSYGSSANASRGQATYVVIGVEGLRSESQW